MVLQCRIRFWDGEVTAGSYNGVLPRHPKSPRVLPGYGKHNRGLIASRPAHVFYVAADSRVCAMGTVPGQEMRQRFHTWREITVSAIAAEEPSAGSLSYLSAW